MRPASIVTAALVLATGPALADDALSVKLRAGLVGVIGQQSLDPARAVVVATTTRLTRAPNPPIMRTETWLTPATGAELAADARLEALDFDLAVAWGPAAWNLAPACSWGVRAGVGGGGRGQQRALCGVIVSSTARGYLSVLLGVDQRAAPGDAWRPSGEVSGWIDVGAAGGATLSVVGRVIVTRSARVEAGVVGGWGR